MKIRKKGCGCWHPQHKLNYNCGCRRPQYIFLLISFIFLMNFHIYIRGKKSTKMFGGNGEQNESGTGGRNLELQIFVRGAGSQK